MDSLAWKIPWRVCKQPCYCSECLRQYLMYSKIYSSPLLFFQSWIKHFSIFLVWAKRCHTPFEASRWPLLTLCRDFRRSYSESCGKPLDEQFFVTFCYLNVTLPFKYCLLKLICDLKAQKTLGTYCSDIFPRVTCTFWYLTTIFWLQERASKKHHLDPFQANHCHHAILYEQVKKRM